LVDSAGTELSGGGAALRDLDRIDVAGFDERVADTRFTVASDVDNPLVGTNGAAAVYGPQKGASADDIDVLDAALTRYAEVVRRDLGVEVAQLAGAGAAGGLGAGAIAFLGAEITSGIELLLDVVGFGEALRDADLVLTGEGSLDEQSLSGKAPIGVARAASPSGVPVFALCGQVTVTAAQLSGVGIDRAWSLLDLESDVERAQQEAAMLLTQLAERAVRAFAAPSEDANERARAEGTRRTP